MGERVSDDIAVAAPPEQVWNVIDDLEAYTQWAEGVEDVDVQERDDDGRPTRARFKVDAKVLQVSYTLTYTYGDDNVTWELVEGEQINQLDGEYEVTPDGDGSHVRYTLEVDFDIPLPGFLKKRGAKRILDTGLKGLKKRAESLA
ncbi:MAG: SRPBCC family protein [Actinobacteria bacterium]|nr:SRPBCC family protein [Actinomycetota bacterium]